jgi:hypothetical protein
MLSSGWVLEGILTDDERLRWCGLKFVCRGWMVRFLRIGRLVKIKLKHGE